MSGFYFLNPVLFPLRVQPSTTAVPKAGSLIPKEQVNPEQPLDKPQQDGNPTQVGENPFKQIFFSINKPFSHHSNVLTICEKMNARQMVNNAFN